jgi:cytochrome o ubiquinol oxidase subunit II
MKRTFKIALVILILIGVVATVASYLGRHSIAVLDPKGMIGMKQRDLLYTAMWLMFIVVIPVFILTIAFAWKYRESNKKAKYTPDWDFDFVAECLWWGIPCAIILVLGIITYKSSHELDPYRPIENGTQPIEIQVVALEWKWLFIYPEQGIATVNFVQFPENTPINFKITADAPMNSFWIPQLGGQIYAMPAMQSELHLIANETGSFRGCSANISGEGFAGMTFIAKATTKADFDLWVESVKNSPNHLGLAEYQQLAVRSQYQMVSVYSLTKSDLYDHIIMKYLSPQKK